MPRAVSAVEFSLWDGYDAVVEASALAWSAEAVRRMESGVFGPPIEFTGIKRRYDGFNEMAQDGWRNALDAATWAAFAGEEVTA